MSVESESMYNRTGQRSLESTYSSVGEAKVLFSTIAKPGMFGIGMAPRENFLAYSTQFIFSIIRIVLENVVMVIIYMYGKSPITGE